MSKYQIAVVVGSLRKDSFNGRLADALGKLAPADFSFKRIEIGDLPLYNQDDDATPAAPVQRLRTDVKAAHGVLFVTPEYNRSIPGVLKNAIDHGSRPYGQSVWSGKPAGVIGTSPGAIGSAASCSGRIRGVRNRSIGSPGASWTMRKMRMLQLQKKNMLLMMIISWQWVATSKMVEKKIKT